MFLGGAISRLINANANELTFPEASNIVINKDLQTWKWQEESN